MAFNKYLKNIYSNIIFKTPEMECSPECESCLCGLTSLLEGFTGKPGCGLPNTRYSLTALFSLSESTSHTGVVKPTWLSSQSPL